MNAAYALKTTQLFRERARRGSTATMPASLMDNKSVSRVIFGLFRSRNRGQAAAVMSQRQRPHARTMTFVYLTAARLQSRCAIARSQQARVNVDARFSDESGKRMSRRKAVATGH